MAQKGSTNARAVKKKATPTSKKKKTYKVGDKVLQKDVTRLFNEGYWLTLVSALDIIYRNLKGNYQYKHKNNKEWTHLNFCDDAMATYTYVVHRKPVKSVKSGKPPKDLYWPVQKTPLSSYELDIWVEGEAAADALDKGYVLSEVGEYSESLYYYRMAPNGRYYEVKYGRYNWRRHFGDREDFIKEGSYQIHAYPEQVIRKVRIDPKVDNLLSQAEAEVANIVNNMLELNNIVDRLLAIIAEARGTKK